MTQRSKQDITVPAGSSLGVDDYWSFLTSSASLMQSLPHYMTEEEGIDSVELAHIIPHIPETLIALYVGINDAVCNKALVTSFLVRHAHKNVFVFDPGVFSGGSDVPSGTVDARQALNGFQPPNESWNSDWTYVMANDPDYDFDDLWHENGYIDMIAAKFEDFTMLSDPSKAAVCFYIDEKAFEHPVNAGRGYLDDARKRGDCHAEEFTIPEGLEGEVNGLVPVILNRGEKLYVARPDFGPCDHSWSNIHPVNTELAVINENSAVPLDLIIAKPHVSERYSQGLIPARGSADMTTDWFFRGQSIVRKPLLKGTVRG